VIKYPEYKKVLFCTDFSENADYAFAFAYGIAERDKGLLYILHVIPPYPHQMYAYMSPDELERVEKAEQEYLNDMYMKHYVKNINDGVQFEIITESGREDEQILHVARDNQVDLIVMGTHGRTGIEHVFFGSVAERVIRNSTFPVFVIPCKKKSECA
jgi:nucleotide-binding universal stress UspA family protein